MGNEKQQESLDKLVRDERLDIVKAISISLVLVWHLHPIKIVVGKIPHNLITTAKFIVDQMYLNLTLVAVPLFILTSLFLLFQKLQVSGFKYLVKRCWRLLEIFIFWAIFQFFIYYFISFIILGKFNKPFSWNIPNFNIYKLLAGIQPSLPIVGDSVFYFLLVILELTLISYALFYWRIWKTNKLKDYIGVAIIVISLFYFEALNLTGQGLSYWELANFLVYIPIAYFLIRQNKVVARKYILALYLLFLVFSLQDIYLRVNSYQIGIYSRVSVICGASAIFISCLNLRNWQASASIKFLSKFSLGIFAIHKYWQFIISFFVLKMSQTLAYSPDIFVIDPLNIFIAVATTFLTFMSVRLLNKTPFQKFIK